MHRTSISTAFVEQRFHNGHAGNSFRLAAACSAKMSSGKWRKGMLRLNYCNSMWDEATRQRHIALVDSLTQGEDTRYFIHIAPQLREIDRPMLDSLKSNRNRPHTTWL